MGFGSEYPERLTYGNRRTERRGQVYPFKNYTEPACPRFRADPFFHRRRNRCEKSTAENRVCPAERFSQLGFSRHSERYRPHGTVWPYRLVPRSSQGDRLIAEEMIARVGMDGYEDRQINELSGGQQQRVFLARALAQEASVYLLDEPFKGVDMQTEKIIVRILKEMESRGKTILVVHHALRTVPLYFDHVAMINRRLIAAGSVRDVFTEENIEKTFSPSKGV